MKNELIFKLSDSEYIKMILNDQIDFLYCDEMKAYFVNQEQICIGENSVGNLFDNFIKRLIKAIDNKLQLHESIIQNLGLMENQYCQEMPNHSEIFYMVQTIKEKSKYWIGSDYEIFGTYCDTNPMLATWLYNDKDGNIIFEVTPVYKWSFFPDDLEDPDFITHEEFMKDYKSLIHRIIPREIAVTWLEQAMKVYRGFYSTEENYQRAIKELGW